MQMLFDHRPRVSSVGVVTSLFFAHFLLGPADSKAQTTTTTASPAAVSSSHYVCPKCGRLHATKPSPTNSSRVTTLRPAIPAPASPSASKTVTAPTISQPAPVRSGVRNVLSILNGQRSRQGLRTLRYDPALQAVAERRARQMASSGRKGHPPGSFAPGRYEGVGWSSSFSPGGVYACYTSDPNMTVAGAAAVTGRDGVYFAVVYR